MTYDEAKKSFELLFEHKLDDKQMREFLLGMTLDENTSVESIAAAAEVMRSHAVALPIPDELRLKSLDIVGTGGDKIGSFNISTTVSLLLASMGCVVAKHGSRSITSQSGSADVLETLGINLDLSPKNQVKMLEETGFCFIFAMNHHPVMKHLMPIRKSIEYRTIFNILGPLTNPAGAKKYLLGVFSPEYIERMAKALLELDVKRAFVVSSQDGMDEISLAAKTDFAYVEGGIVSQGVIDPEAYGFKLAPQVAIIGGSAQENAQITRDIFSGEEEGAKRDIVVINAAFALFVDGNVRDMQEAIEMVEAQLDSAKTSEHLNFMADVSQKLA